ncbi:response regulator [Fictibacillus sp. S7]|uniref:response regulator n=1 Tax=Fictibacillus sp. S7 TaxID=2212476 RepID=UPI001012A60C|nr:response regulator [Fictibacillus sp. S7]RXZ02349.1 DNA-binding response regulator [Fictibacillus sp. S7]
MKVLIIDDEKHVRDGIRLLGAWEENGIGEFYEAENGEDAIRLIQEHRPEIIFSDMKMPKMDGTQLLEWIKTNQPKSKTVVVTGYDDYHYMRKAIHFGSYDYLLKPIDPEILNQTLKNAVEEWKKEEADRKSKDSSYQMINEMKPVFRDRKLTQLVSSDSIKDELYKELGFQLSLTYMVALMRLDGKTIKSFQGDRDLAYFTILNVINEILMDCDCGIGFRYLSSKGEIVLIFWNKLDQIEERLSEIHQTLKRVLNRSCPIAIGEAVTGTAGLLQSYQHAKQVLLSSNLLERKEKRVYGPDTVQVISPKSLMSYSSDIEGGMMAGRIEAFDDLIEDVTNDFTENGYLSLKQLLHFENEYQVISNTWFKHYNIPIGSSESIEKRIDPYFDAGGTFNLEDYKKRIRREISVFLKKVKKASKQKGNIIHEIEKYLQSHFDRDVKLQEISDHFYISREYISRKFKQELNVNISDYLVRIRMNKAKSLLKNSDLKIYEIANMIGYQDDKYFRKVFKKVEGITPNEYRDQYSVK